MSLCQPWGTLNIPGVSETDPVEIVSVTLCQPWGTLKYTGGLRD